MVDRAYAVLLARHRRAAGLTQEELAEKSGVSARAISDLERGRARRPQRRTCQALASALALAGDELAEFLGTGGFQQIHTEPETEPDQPAPDRPMRELPPVVELAGRDEELDRVLRLADGASDTQHTAVVVGVHGAPGVGKTAFAVHAGHRLVERYPDGCLFVNLRGTDPDQLTADQALARLLVALGTNEARLPTGVEERAGLYRALLRDRRILLVLDNAADEAQVRPLIPSTPGCLVLITSRRVLSGLEAVARVPLEVLRPVAAVRLLTSIVGEHRAQAEPDAITRVAELCGNLPLALRIAGNRLATRPRWRIGHLVGHLEDQRRRLTTLTAGDLQVRSAFEVSYRMCDPSTRAVFRLLSLVPPPEVHADLVAVLAGTDVDTAERRLEELVDVSLLEPGVLPDRYTPHDLLRVFAAERLALEDSPDRVRAAEVRMISWMLGTATRAGMLLCPPGSGPDEPPAGPDVVYTAAEAIEWLDVERPRWLAAVRAAARMGRHEEVLAFSRAMHWYSEIRAYADLWREIFGLGVASAQALGRRRDEAVQLNFLGWALTLTRTRNAEALAVHEKAWRAARETGDRNEEAWALQYCGRTELVQGKAAEAAEYIRPAIALFDELGDDLGKYVTLSILGIALHKLGDYPAAIDAHGQTVAFFRTPEMRPHGNLLAIGLLRLADTLEAAGDVPVAEETFREAQELANAANYPQVEGLAAFGRARCATDDPIATRRHLETARAVFRQADEPWHHAQVLDLLAEAVVAAEPGLAAEHRAQAAELCARVNTPEARALMERLEQGDSALVTDTRTG
ncbi:ATP-binding protein [Actinokineospora enzanensis]|uniref:ATP-binding protein n=1 Tax=Actinokineospora enzanensis TaxID=155975 RepID=UPI00039C338D|nr:NB-ARC domain-containing protein [Actinokineospora enzanensis]